MKIIGLTGSIGMGKSVAAAQLASLGARVLDADAVARELLAPGGAAVRAVSAAFPEAVVGGMIDRTVLAGIVFSDPEKKRALESIIHPLVGQAEQAFIENARVDGVRFAVLDVPLLYETGRNTLCDAVIVVTAPPWIQKRRVLRRPGMTQERFKQILASQMPDLEKRRRADFVVQTGLGRAYSYRKLANILKTIEHA